MAASMSSMAGRRTIVRFLCRAPTNSASRRPALVGSPRTLLRTPVVNSSPLRSLRRELSSFKPIHNAIASAYLVSKLPCDGSTSNEGRFANYLSPI